MPYRKGYCVPKNLSANIPQRDSKIRTSLLGYFVKKEFHVAVSDGRWLLVEDVLLLSYVGLFAAHKMVGFHAKLYSA